MENGTVIQVFGEPIEILASSTATNHAFVVGLQTSPPGGGPPPHRHLGEDEIFTVVDGKFEFFDGTSWTPMHRGQTRYSLRGSYHAFRNAGDSNGKMLFVTTGGGLDEYFAKISSLRLPDDLQRLLEISKSYRYEYLPAPNSDPAFGGKGSQRLASIEVASWPSDGEAGG
jgi:quercetin dioxygenase-like cupin family protein